MRPLGRRPEIHNPDWWLWIPGSPPSARAEPVIGRAFARPVGATRRRRPAMTRASGHHAMRLFHDGEAHAGAVAVLFGDLTPAVLGLLAGLERTLHLCRALHQLVE